MSNDKPRPPPSMPDPAKMHEIAMRAITTFKNGQMTELESALGMLYMGYPLQVSAVISLGINLRR